MKNHKRKQKEKERRKERRKKKQKKFIVRRENSGNNGSSSSICLQSLHNLSFFLRKSTTAAKKPNHNHSLSLAHTHTSNPHLRAVNQNCPAAAVVWPNTVLTVQSLTSVISSSVKGPLKWWWWKVNKKMTKSSQQAGTYSQAHTQTDRQTIWLPELYHAM